MTSQRWLESGRTLSFLAILFAVASPAAAATLLSGFSESLVASGLANPTAMQFAPDGRLFVCEQGGRLRVIKDGVLLPTPFVTLSVNSSGERGLLGVAFDPEFATNHYVYVYYTVPSPVHNRISRFTANGDVAVPGSELVLLDLNNLTATNHNGGALNFGPDGKLYAAVGENAVGSNAQSMNNLLGKMLRLNADGTIPADNPFFASATGQNRAIWALGLRNPFTFAFHPVGGQMFINDVGAGTWEEINDGVAGANYGWPDTEGVTTDPRFQSPRYAYNHSGGACAITGGAFYSPPAAQFPASYAGDYFFADYCGGWIRKLDPANGNSVVNFASGISLPVDLKVADDGSLYYLSYGSGSVYRIEYVDADILWRHSSGQNYVWLMNGTERIGEGHLATVDPTWQVVGAADHNGDGHADILWRHDSGSNYMWLMNGTARIGEGHLAPVDAAWQTVGTGDYNGDGRADILWRHTSGANYLWLMNGTARIGEGHLAPVDSTWQVAGAGDHNGDGHADILWRHSSGTNYVWLMNGTARIGEGHLAPVDPAWQIAGTGDYNGDGRADILWRHSSGSNYLWAMDGTQRIGEGHLAPVDPAWQIAATGDYNSDGRADILWRHSSGSNYMWLMDGTTRVGEGHLAPVDPAWQVVGPR
jgi:glucose/arabinose dehydrogenase